MAKEGCNPGWDIQYEDAADELIAVEVKGTTDSSFASIELTGGEWKAAGGLESGYWLFRWHPVGARIFRHGQLEFSSSPNHSVIQPHGRNWGSRNVSRPANCDTTTLMATVRVLPRRTA
jgi:hypothetical protein